MKNKLFLFIAGQIIIFTACQSPKEKTRERIKELEANDSTFNVSIQTELTNEYIHFVEKYPDDTQSPEYLLKASQRFQVFGKFNESIATLDKILKNYPKSELCAQALFVKAFTYENNLNEFALAKENYTLFLQKYPKHELSEAAQLAIQNLGKTPEQIIDSLYKE